MGRTCASLPLLMLAYWLKKRRYSRCMPAQDGSFKTGVLHNGLNLPNLYHRGKGVGGTTRTLVAEQELWVVAVAAELPYCCSYWCSVLLYSCCSRLLLLLLLYAATALLQMSTGPSRPSLPPTVAVAVRCFTTSLVAFLAAAAVLF